MSRDFDGTTGYLEFPGATITAFPVTMACWFNPDSITASQVLMSLGTSGGTARIQLVAAGAFAGDPIQANSITSGAISVVASSATGYSLKNWHHAAAVFTSLTSRTAYIDGVAGTTETTSNDPSIGGLNRFVLGARISAGAYGAFLDGRLAESAIWNEELSAAGIAALARGHSPQSIRPQALVAYFPLRSRLGVVLDAKNNYNLMRTGSVLDGGHPSIIRRKHTARIYSFPSGAINLTPSLFDDADAFYAATVAAGAINLSPSLFLDADTFYASTVAPGAVALTPALFADGDTFYAATVAGGSLTLAPSLFVDGDAFHAATVAAGTIDLAPSLFVDADTFFASTVAPGAVALTPSIYADADTFYAAAVAVGAVNVAPGLVTDPDTFYVATVSQDGATQGLTPSLYTDADTFHAATVAAGYNLAPAAYADADAFYAATVAAGAVALSPALYADTDAFYAAIVAGGSSAAGRLIAELTINAALQGSLSWRDN